MKGLTIKKVAAVAAGAALVGTAFAPIVSAQLSLQKSDIFNDSGTPNVKVVVGSDSAPRDGVWAGNIAAAIAEQARAYRSVSVSGDAGSATASVTDLSAKLVVGGTVTFDNAKTYKAGETSNTNDLNSDTAAPNVEFGPVTLTKSSLDNLINEQRTIKWAGNDYSRTFKEEIGIKADAYFDYAGERGAADLELLITGQNDINYSVNLGSGIPWYESTTSTDNFADASNDNIKIPFFGTHYLYRSGNKSNSFLRLIKEQDKLSFVEGDVITGLKGKNSLAGQDVSVKVDSVTAAGPAATTYSAKFILIDAEGNEVDVYTAATGESLDDQFEGEDGEEALETILYVDTINVGASSGVGEVQVTIGTTLVDLYGSKGYPYDSGETSYDYRVTLTNSSDGNYVTRITIGNDKEKWSNSTADAHEPLYPGESGQALTSTGQSGESEAAFLSSEVDGTLGKNFFTVYFQGFETDEELAVTKFTASGITYRDASDRSHTVWYYKELSKSGDSSFTFDGQTIYYQSTKGTTDQVYIDVNATNGGNINGVKWLAKSDSNTANDDTTKFDGANKKLANTVDINAGTGWSNSVLAGTTIDLNGFYAYLDDVNVSVLGTIPDTNSVMFRLGFDGNVTFAKAPINASTASTDYLISSWTGSDGNVHRDLYWADANTLSVDHINPRQAYTGAFVPLQGVDDVVYNYVLYADAGGDSLWLLLAGRADGGALGGTIFDGRFDADFYLYGTDIGEDSDVNAKINPHGIPGTTPGIQMDGNGWTGPDKPYYWLDHSDFGEGVSAQTFYIATFSIETTGNTTTAADGTPDYDTNFYINTATHLAPDVSLTDLTGYSSDINYNVGDVDGTLNFGLDESTATTTQPSIAYNDTGGKMEVSGGEMTFTIPDGARRAVMVVKTEGTTTTTTGGEELVIAEGESGTTEAGTEITVEEITYSATCVAGEGDGETTCAASPENYFEPASVPEQMVYLDTEAPSGTLVLVGGHFVNALSAQVSNIRDVLTASGDGRTPWQDTDTGNWVVAGYTADDTVASARAFIAAVEAIDMTG